eukprot:gene11090-2012_t
MPPLTYLCFGAGQPCDFLVYGFCAGDSDLSNALRLFDDELVTSYWQFSAWKDVMSKLLSEGFLKRSCSYMQDGGQDHQGKGVVGSVFGVTGAPSDPGSIISDSDTQLTDCVCSDSDRCMLVVCSELADVASQVSNRVIQHSNGDPLGLVLTNMEFSDVVRNEPGTMTTDLSSASLDVACTLVLLNLRTSSTASVVESSNRKYLGVRFCHSKSTSFSSSSDHDLEITRAILKIKQHLFQLNADCDTADERIGQLKQILRFMPSKAQNHMGRLRLVLHIRSSHLRAREALEELLSNISNGISESHMLSALSNAEKWLQNMTVSQ